MYCLLTVAVPEIWKSRGNLIFTIIKLQSIFDLQFKIFTPESFELEFKMKELGWEYESLIFPLSLSLSSSNNNIWKVVKMRSQSSEYNEDKNIKRLSEFIPL